MISDAASSAIATAASPMTSARPRSDQSITRSRRKASAAEAANGATVAATPSLTAITIPTAVAPPLR